MTASFDFGKVMQLLYDLRQLYEPEGVGIWLYASNAQWDGLSAMDMIAQGRIDELLQVTDQLLSGAYS